MMSLIGTLVADRVSDRALCSGALESDVICDPDARVVLSSLGWVDRGALWRFDIATGEQDTVVLSDADYLRVFDGDRQHFVVQHHWGADRFRVTAQTWMDPGVPVSSIEVNGWVPHLDGDASVWSSLRSAYVGSLGDDATGAAGYFVLTVRDGAVDLARLDWFDGHYDQGYQGVTSVHHIPGTSQYLFGVQRSSDLVLVDEDDWHVVRRIPLAGRGGNPSPVFSKRDASVWAVDYDTVVRLDRRSWQVLGSSMLQPAIDRTARFAGRPWQMLRSWMLRPTIDKTAMFVGRPWLSADEVDLVIPRPASGDVVVLDPQDLTPRASVAVGQEPLVAVALAGGRVLARDWKTGTTLSGDLNA
jgi:hypothetical protein